MIRTTALLAALVATAATVSFPAYAGETAPTTQVHYADLNLASPAGAQALKARVARAADRDCSSEAYRKLDSAKQARSCIKVAMAKAMPQVELALANAGTQVAENGRVTVAAH